MAVTVALQTYYGIEAPRETFWTRTGETVVCGGDLNHAITEGAQFCPVCGTEVKTISIETPSPRFTEICEKAGLEPAQFFDVLCGNSEHGWEWEDDGEGGSGQSFRLFWLNVEAFIESGRIQSDAQPISALGFKLEDLAHSRWNPERPRVLAVSYREMALYDRAMREVAQIFGIEGEPKLYSQGYYG